MKDFVAEGHQRPTLHSIQVKSNKIMIHANGYSEACFNDWI